MEQFRTTASLVFWTETTDESEGIVAGLNALLPPGDQAATLATIDYVATGRPVVEQVLPAGEVTP